MNITQYDVVNKVRVNNDFPYFATRWLYEKKYMLRPYEGQSNHRSLGAKKEAMGSRTKKFSILGDRNVLVYSCIVLVDPYTLILNLRF